MVIISQDKRSIINFENIKTIELDGNTNYTSINIFRETNEVETGVCGLFIGHYETEERAKKVLEKIASFYEKSKRNDCDSMKFYFEDAYVFRMPEE